MNGLKTEGGDQPPNPELTKCGWEPKPKPREFRHVSDPHDRTPPRVKKLKEGTEPQNFRNVSGNSKPKPLEI
jgi:hypothetical protein